MSLQTNNSPTDPPDESCSLPDGPDKTTSDDRQKLSRNHKEYQTPQTQTGALSPKATVKDLTNFPRTRPSTRSTQIHSTISQDLDKTTNATPPSQSPSPPTPTQTTATTPTSTSQLRTLIFIHLLTGRLQRHLAIIPDLLYNDPEHLQPLLENPPARLSEHAREILRGKRRKRPESSDRQGRAHAPIAHRRRRESSSSGSDGEGSVEGSGSESVARGGDEDDGGEVEGIAAWWEEFDREKFLVKMLVAVAIMVKLCCWICGWLLNR